MMFKSAVIASLVASAAAFIPNDGIQADSKIGQKLMSKARALEQNNGEATWLVGYKIKYLGCSSLIQVNPEGAEGEDQSLLYTQNLVKFGLCKNDVACSSCGSGEAQYVVPMNEFVDAWTESKMTAQEQECENVRENCYCDNANDDQACENQCYVSMGMDYCVQYEGEEEFNVQRFMECAEMEGADGNQNNNNNNGQYYGNNKNANGVDMYRQYYTGLTCASNGYDINLGIFLDAGCTTLAQSGVYAAFNYGASLPYENESLVGKGECMKCMQVDENNNNNNNNQGQNNNNQYNGNYYYQNAEVNEFCEQAYMMSAKCEKNLSPGSSYFYADTTGCEYINNILPRLTKATNKVAGGSGVSASGGSASVAFAVIFFLTSMILGAYSFFLYRKIHRAKVNLAQSEGMMMA